jgi:hypothetical protein
VYEKGTLISGKTNLCTSIFESSTVDTPLVVTVVLDDLLIFFWHNPIMLLDSGSLLLCSFLFLDHFLLSWLLSGTNLGAYVGLVDGYVFVKEGVPGTAAFCTGSGLAIAAQRLFRLTS